MCHTAWAVSRSNWKNCWKRQNRHLLHPFSLFSAGTSMKRSQTSCIPPPSPKKVRLISDGQRLQQYQQNKLLLVTSNLWTLKNTMKCTDLNLSLQCTGTAVTASIWSRIPKGLNSKVSIGLVTYVRGT